MTEKPTTPTILLKVRFHAQAWVNDNAVSVDPEGETDWEIDWPLTGGPLPQDDQYESDNFRTETRAPAWVTDWSGPFYVEILNRDEAEAIIREIAQLQAQVAQLRGALEKTRAELYAFTGVYAVMADEGVQTKGFGTPSRDHVLFTESIKAIDKADVALSAIAEPVTVDAKLLTALEASEAWIVRALAHGHSLPSDGYMTRDIITEALRLARAKQGGAS